MGSLTDFLEARARGQNPDLPAKYGYRADTPLGVGYWMEALLTL